MPFTDKLNPAQRKAVRHAQGPLLIVAGAGTGKTTVITERIGWLIKEGLAEPHEILALTFTDKAAGEMQERVDQLLPMGYLEMWISTFHAFGERILQAHGIDIGLPTEFRLLTQTEQWMFIHEHLDEFDLDYYRPLGNPAKFIAAMISHFSRLKDEHISPKEYLAYAESLRLDRDQQEFAKRKDDDDTISEAKRVEEIANAYHTYEQLLVKEGALDFGSLITYTLELFTKRPNLLKKYREQFKFILVDEFQDTNYAQYELIKVLAKPRDNLTVVGDDDQSIYKFRGASISNILEFKKDFPKAAQVVLTENYRSKQNILDLAYRFIQLNNPNRLEVELTKEKRESKSRTEPGTRGRSVRIQPEGSSGGGGVSKKLKAAQKGEGLIECMREATEAEEASAVVKKIAELKSEDQRLAWSDFAILVRANDHAQPFIVALERAGVPYQAVTSRGLYGRPEILDLLAYLKLVDNYHESAAVFRVLSSRAFNIPTADLTILNEESSKKSQSLFETVRLAGGLNISEKTKNELTRFLRVVEKHTELARRGSVHEVALAFLSDTKYMHELTEGGKAKDQNAQHNIETLHQFFRVIQEFERGNDDTSTKAFLLQIDLERRAGERGRIVVDLDTGPDAVRVMTVHTAKGLEFPYVFLVQLVEQRFPTIERKEPIRIPDPLVKETVPEGDIHLEEERRLFYVGMTRAKSGVFFTSARDYGGARAKRPSRFLHELGLVEKKPKKEGKATPQALPLPETRERKKEPLKIAKEVTYSFSSLAKYAACPLQYKFAFVLKVPARGNHHFSFGTTVHNTLYQFLQLVGEREQAKQGDLFGESAEHREKASAGKLPVSVEELLEMYEKNFVNEWYRNRKQRDDYFAKGKEVLKEFYAKYAEAHPTHLALEQGFRVKVAGRTIRGKIDRVDKAGDKAVIIDYKTGKPKRKIAKEDKRQLMLYASAVKDEHVMHKDVAKVVYYYLEDGSLLSLEPTAEDYKEVEEWVDSVAGKIEQEDFTPTPGFVCRHCEYRDICDFADRSV